MIDVEECRKRDLEILVPAFWPVFVLVTQFFTVKVSFSRLPDVKISHPTQDRLAIVKKVKFVPAMLMGTCIIPLHSLKHDKCESSIGWVAGRLRKELEVER